MEGNHHPPVSPESLENVPRAEVSAYLAAHRMGGFVRDLATDRIALDPGAQAIFEFEPGEFDGRLASLHERVVPDDLAVLNEQPEAVFGKAEYGGYFRVACRDGSTRWAHVQGSIQRDDDGAAVRAVGFLRDAGTEFRHLAEQTVLAAERKHQTDIIQSINTSLARVMTVKDLLAFLTGESFLDAVGAAGAGLSVVDRDRRELLALKGVSEDFVRQMAITRLEAPLPGPEVIRRQTPLFINRDDVRENYPLLWPFIEPTDVTLAAILPLTAQGQPTGALSLLYAGKSEFAPEEANLLFALGSIFAQSLRRALLYDREHSVAVALQQAMLPRSIPDAPGLHLVTRYQPASAGHRVGGDWYDAMLHSDGTVGLAVGDVQGHDIRAAAVMGQLRTAMRAYLGDGHSLSEVMGRTSMFLSDMDTDLMATCVCVHLDPTTGYCQIVRAGHPYPVIRSADHGSARVEAAGGLPLGLAQYSDIPYPTTHINLGVGDTLLLCTDGMLEAHRSDLETGERRIATLLAEGPDDLEALADHLITSVDKEQHTEDDIALLLAKRTGLG